MSASNTASIRDYQYFSPENGKILTLESLQAVRDTDRWLWYGMKQILLGADWPWAGVILKGLNVNAEKTHLTEGTALFGLANNSFVLFELIRKLPLPKKEGSELLLVLSMEEKSGNDKLTSATSQVTLKSEYHTISDTEDRVQYQYIPLIYHKDENPTNDITDLARLLTPEPTLEKDGSSSSPKDRWLSCIKDLKKLTLATQVSADLAQGSGHDGLPLDQLRFLSMLDAAELVMRSRPMVVTERIRLFLTLYTHVKDAWDENNDRVITLTRCLVPYKAFYPKLLRGLGESRPTNDVPNTSSPSANQGCQSD